MFMFIKVAAISSVSAKHNGVFVFLPFRWSDCFLFVCLFFFLVHLLQRLKKVMEERAKAYLAYRQFIAVRAKYYFQMMLSQRGYNGKIVFDHGNESLSLQVCLKQAL